jgi:hypothetical protein
LGSGGLTDPDSIPGVPENLVARPSDIWLVGGHRQLVKPGQANALAVSIGDLFPTDAADFRPDLECFGPRISMLRGSNVIAAEVEEVIDLIVG